MFDTKIGQEMYSWASDLFPINRSLTGDGVRETLQYIKRIFPDLEINGVRTGTKVFDWEIPQEWHVTDAYIITPDGEKIADFKQNNLHLMGYSTGVNQKMSLDELQEHLYSLKDLPEAIPYITSYYSKNWKFCISEDQRKSLPEGEYTVVIDSSFKDGELNYGELLIKGSEKNEILISTYICHPSMGNNELSGPVVTMQLINWLQNQENLRYSYRIVFVPETIGSIAYIQANYPELKKNTVGGFVITCVGDDNNYSLLHSKWETTLMDKIGLNVLKHHTNGVFKKYSFLDRGSDERQYSSVGVDIPMISLMRSKYGEYKEYHTSLDNMEFISPEGLFGGFEIHRKAIYILENNYSYKVIMPCEPQLGKKGLYPLQSTKDTQEQVELMMNIIAYSDGELDLLSIAEKVGGDFFVCKSIVDKLIASDLMVLVHDKSKRNFINDLVIRSHDNFDQIYRSNLSFARDSKVNQDYGPLYDAILDNILKNTTLLGEKVSNVEYHERFGWVLSGTNKKAYLGKINLTGKASIEIGNMTYFSGSIIVNGNAHLEIGSYCSLANGIEIFTSNINHPTSFTTTYNLHSNARIVENAMGLELPNFHSNIKQLKKRKDVTIGNDVWIGRDVLIMNGINIGDGCIIGTRSTITKDCEPYGVYVGTPAKLVKYRFNQDIITQLLAIKWWNWSYEKIRRNKPFFDQELAEYSGSLRRIIIE
jgi:aminopeptidase-like protein/acetyltransferase-like isoleucine patch superfamily enzyme